MCLVTFSHLNLTFQKRKRKADEKDKKRRGNRQRDIRKVNYKKNNL
jgi:hypothetical protein